MFNYLNVMKLLSVQLCLLPRSSPCCLRKGNSQCSIVVWFVYFAKRMIAVGSTKFLDQSNHTSHLKKRKTTEQTCPNYCLHISQPSYTSWMITTSETVILLTIKTNNKVHAITHFRKASATNKPSNSQQINSNCNRGPCAQRFHRVLTQLKPNQLCIDELL